MRIFFPNASIQYPPTRGADIHRFQLIKELRKLGHEVRTLAPDRNPFAEVRPRTAVEVLRALRWADVLYCRVEETVNDATRLGSWPLRAFVPDDCTVAWELNVSITGSTSAARPRGPALVENDLRQLRRHAKRVDVAIGVTAMVAEQARELLGIGETLSIQNGSDPELFRRDLAGSPTEGNLQVVTIASGPNTHHDSELVAAACRLIDEEHLPIEVHAFGNCSTASTGATAGSLVFHGPISYFDLPARLAVMDVGLALYNIPLDTGSPLKLFDYLASGCVPVCSGGAAVREVLDGADAGLVNTWTPRSLVDALMALHADRPQLLRRRAEGRRLLTERYTWGHVASRTAEALEGAIAARARRRR